MPARRRIRSSSIHRTRTRAHTKAHAQSRSFFETRTAGILFMLINCLTWGAALPISKFAVESTDSFYFLLYRYGSAAILSLPLVIPLWRKFKPTLANLGEIVLLESIGITVALSLLYRGLSLTSSLEASLLTLTIPVFVTLGGIVFLKEKQEGYEWLGLFIALAGTVLLTFEPLLSGRTNGQLFTSLEGNILIVLSNIAAATYYLLAKRRYVRYPKLFASGVSFWIGAISFLAIAAVVSGRGNVLPSVSRDLSSAHVLWPSLYMGIFGSIIGLTAYIKGQDLMEASEASLFTYLQPIVTIPAAFLLHREVPTTTMLLALLVILAGVSLAEFPKHRRTY
jgi:drug/metabolite transporter (DMT)-like permease